jgi:hypothetical protein
VATQAQHVALESATTTEVGQQAVEQADAADEAGASDGVSQLIRSVGRTIGE